MKKFNQLFAGLSPLAYYQYNGFLAVSFSSFRLALLLEEENLKKGEVYIKENLYGGIGKVFNDVKNGVPCYLFQMLTETVSGSHDKGIYLTPSIMNTTVIRSQESFKYNNDDSTGFVSEILVLTNIPCLEKELKEPAIINSFNMRLAKKLEQLQTQQ